MKPGVDVVVVNWRTPEDLDNFMDGIAGVPIQADHDIWLFNVEARKEDLIVGERAVDELGVHHLISGSNIGYAKAVNAAVAKGDREVIAIFNADVVIHGSVVDNCVDALMENDDWAILGPKQVDDQNLITHGGIFGTLEQPKHRGWHSIDDGRYDDVREAVTVSGAAYFIKRSVWEEMTNHPDYKAQHPDALGAFLPTQHYYEETFCSYFAQHLGYKVVYYGAQKAVHLWHRSSPVGGEADKQVKISREIFRNTCDAMGIPHD